MGELDELADLVASLEDAPSFSATADCLVAWARERTGAASAFVRLNQKGSDGTLWVPTCRCEGAGADFARDEALVAGDECVCGHVATGNVLPGSTLFTERGSFVSTDFSSLDQQPQAEEAGPLRGRCMGEGYRSVAVVPLGGPQGPVGCLHLADRRPRLFDGGLHMIESACRVAGRILLHHQAREREHAVLQTIQQALLPSAAAEVAGLNIGVCFASATDLASIGGDFYDVVDRGHGGAILLTGDYSGHGIQAAGVASHARLVLSGIARQAAGPGEVLETANARLLGQVPPHHFVSAAVCAIDPAEGRVRVALAGHPAPILVRSGRATEVGVPPNLPLGLEPHLRFREQEFELQPGDTLILVTDGVLEARRGGWLFGIEGVDEVVRTEGRTSVSELTAAICAASDRHHDSALPPDDRLALAVSLCPAEVCRPRW